MLYAKVTLLGILSILITLTSASLLNLTDYWRIKLNKPQPLGYHAYSGYESLDWYDKGQIFYTLWSKYNTSIDDTTVPLVIFLEGGPGSASQWAAFNYIGPIRVIGKGEQMHVEEFAHGWNQYAHLLVVDQPINVGFSYDRNNTILTTTEEAGAHFVNFIFNFFKTWGGKERPVYIAGESYAGHYIPVFTELIVSNRSLGLNIKGISIGGPYVHSYVQDNQLDAFLSSHGIVDFSGAEATQFDITRAMLLTKQGMLAQGIHIMNSVFDSEEYFGGANIYNVRQYDEGNTNYDYDDYLNMNKDNLGVPPQVKYIDTNDDIYEAFSYDLGESKEQSLLYCLDRLKVLLYVGQNDAVVSPPGLMTFFNSLNWKFKPQWQKQQKKIMRIGDEVYGWTKKYGRFTLAVINSAGHFVPADQPRAFRLLFLSWLQS